mmetsp:Transcript_32154/g.81182  ORF Transcript_32154/g.81182 Transcript_32154/m.81182 type:complete len:220 (-) Transcript_32154:312-971(-)
MADARCLILPLAVLCACSASAAVVPVPEGQAGGSKVLLRRRASATTDCLEGGPAVGEGAIRFANSSIVINASTAMVWGVLADLEAWGKWNDVFAALIDGPPEVGKRLTLRLYLRTALPGMRHWQARLNVTELKEGRRICFDPVGMPGVAARHCYVLCPVAEGTLMYHYEDQSGLLKHLLLKIMGRVTTEGFKRFNAFLRNQSEAAEASTTITLAETLLP